jgi:AraC-like DNA-binding protein
MRSQMGYRDFSIRSGPLAGIQVVVARSTHAFPKHFHDKYGLGLIDRGAQMSASGRGPVEAVAGDVISVNPGEIHDGTPIGDRGREWRMLYFDPVVVNALCADLFEGAGGTFEFHHPVMSNTRRKAAMQAVFHALASGGKDAATSIEESLIGLFGMIATGAKDRPKASSGVARAIMRIDDDPASAVSLGDLAGDAGLSRFQLLRSFRSVTGLTPHAYQVQRRLALARRLIAAGTPLAHAAFETGFADQSHMTREFSRRFGVTPAAYAAAFV